MSDQQSTDGVGGVISQTTDPPSQPRSIKWAVIGMWLGAVMTVVGVYVYYLEIDAANQKTFGTNYATSEGLAEAGLMISMGIAAVLAVVEIVLWVAMALTNRLGYSWARIVATVLAVIGLLYAIFVIVTAIMSNTLIVVSAVYNLVNEVLAVAIVVLLWSPSSTAFYRDRMIWRARLAMSAEAGSSRPTASL